MATQITASTSRTRPARRLGSLAVAILASIAVVVICVAVWSPAGSTYGTRVAGAALSNMGQYDIHNLGGTPVAGAGLSNMGQYDVDNLGGTPVK